MKKLFMLLIIGSLLFIMPNLNYGKDQKTMTDFTEMTSKDLRVWQREGCDPIIDNTLVQKGPIKLWQSETSAYIACYMPYDLEHPFMILTPEYIILLDINLDGIVDDEVDLSKEPQSTICEYARMVEHRESA